MSRSLRRGAIAAVIAVTIVPLAAACGTGSDPQTLEVKPNSVATSVGDISIQNAFIITEPQGTGAAAVSARVFNNGHSAQQLDSITVQGAADQVTLAGADGSAGPITIPAGGSVTLGGPGNPSAELADSTGVVPGDFTKTVFDFSAGGKVTITPNVVPAQHYFTSYGPTAPASPSPSASASGGPSASASPAGASGSPSASGSPATHKSAKSGAANQPVASGSPKA